MNIVIAEVILFAKRPGEEPFKVTVQIGTPYKHHDDPETWAFPRALTPLFKHLHDAHGGNPFQALCLAIAGAQDLLQDVRDKGGMLGFDGSGDDFPLEAYSFRPAEHRIRKQGK